MSRAVRLFLVPLAAVAVVLLATGCGTERIHLSPNDPTPKADLFAATLFQQRCAGCHTLSFAGTYGSGQNPRTYEAINGPNFNVRCERPAIRVLYAIENGGFSGAYMPQNIVVGQAAREVAMFVSRYAGRQAPAEPGQETCEQQAIGTLPALSNKYAYGQTETVPKTSQVPAGTNTTIGTTKPKRNETKPATTPTITSPTGVKPAKKKKKK